MIKDFLRHDIKVPSLCFHTVNQCGSRLVLYGGINASETICGDLYFVKLEGRSINFASYEKNKSSKITQIIFDFPTPRYSHSADYDPLTERLLIFGGYARDTPKFLDQLCILELKSFPTIVFQTIKSVEISNRCKHASFLYKNRLYIYGGVGIHKVTKKIQILNDFYSIDLTTKDTVVKEVNSKAGIEMTGHLFKALQLNEKNFAFFYNSPNESLLRMFLFNVENEIFVKTIIKFTGPVRRMNYSLNRLSDGRFILFGGMDKEDTFNDCYILINFTYEQERHYTWTNLDIYGDLDEGSSGHAALALENNNLFIHGGSRLAYDPVMTQYIQGFEEKENIEKQVQITKKLKLLNLHDSYYWTRRVYDPIKSRVKPRIQHVGIRIPGENGDEKLFVHGGELDGKVMANYCLYSLQHKKWISVNTRDPVPQLKGHAACLFHEPSKNESYVIMTGGVVKEHQTNCKAGSNDEKENCSCNIENISDVVYAFKDQSFFQIAVTNKNDIGEKLKRYGHSMIITEESVLYMFGGFMQYKGYVSDLIRFLVIYNPKDGFSIKAEEIILKEKMPGRMFASATYVFDRIFIFGGCQDNSTLNDFWEIQLKNNCLNRQFAEYQKDHIYPRFGSSTCLQYDKINEELARVIIFGGSYWTGKYLVPGMSNEILIVEISYKKNIDQVSMFCKLPLVYCETEKNVFHTSIEYEGDIYIFGGINSNLCILNVPKPEDLEVDMSLSEYIDYSSRDKYDYLDKNKVMAAKKREIDEDSMGSDDQGGSKSIDKISLDETKSNDKKKLIVEDEGKKMKGDNIKKTETSSKKDSDNTKTSSKKKKIWDDEYEVNEK